MERFKKNMVYLFSLIVGCLTFVAMGFCFIKMNTSDITISGWNLLNVDFAGTNARAVMVFAKIFLVLCVLCSFALIAVGVIGYIKNKENGGGRFGKIDCVRVIEKLKIEKYWNYVIFGFCCSMIFATLFLVIFCSNNSSKYYRMSVGWGPLLMLFVSFISCVVILFVTYKEKGKNIFNEEVIDVEVKDEEKKQSIEDVINKNEIE